MKPNELDAFYAAAATLRRNGWAVLIYPPADLQDADRQRFEERMDDHAFDLIESMQPEQDWLWSPEDCPEQLEHTNRELD